MLALAVEEFDLEGYLQAHGFEAVRDNEWLGTCPTCGKEKLAVNTEKKRWHCFVCEDVQTVWQGGSAQRKAVTGGGGVLKLVEWLDGLERSDAAEFLISEAGVGDLTKLPDKGLLDQLHDHIAFGPGVCPAPEGSAPITAPLPYMHKRGVTMEDVRTFGLFWTPTGRYANRLVFPVWEDGYLVYWQARAMYEAHEVPPGRRFTKALNPPRTPGLPVSSDVLFNIDLASQHPRVAIVEGPMDVIRTGPDAVCTFGKVLHPAQVQKLVAKGVKAVDLMWDGPSPTEPHGAHPEMLQTAPRLAQFFDVRVVLLPQGDPGDWTREALTHFRASAPNLNQIDPWRVG